MLSLSLSEHTQVLGGYEAWRLVGNETDALHLTLVVEPNDTDKSVGVFLLALLKLVQHLRRICAPKHGELPHGPVASVIVPW